MSPASKVEGKSRPDMKYNKVPFGSYALVWVNTTNTMKRRAIPAIALKESNRVGGMYFMSLSSGRRIHSYHWEHLPIPDEVIQRVKEIANKENQPLMAEKIPMFEWVPGINMVDNNYNENSPSMPTEAINQDTENELHESHEQDSDENISMNDQNEERMMMIDTDIPLISDNDDKISIDSHSIHENNSTSTNYDDNDPIFSYDSPSQDQPPHGTEIIDNNDSDADGDDEFSISNIEINDEEGMENTIGISSSNE